MKNQDLNKEKELIENAQSDSKKFDALYKYFVDDVYRFSYSILNNKHDAEDITSQVFITFYKKLNEFKWQNVSLKYWLFTTSRNLCYTKFRKKPEVEYNDDIHSENFEEVSFVDEIMNKDLLERVKKEIQSLSPAEQELINLRIWEGMQFDEIAKMQDLKLSACKLRFYRAIEKVKKSLEEKNIMHAIAFPFLFTAMRDVGNLEAYHASAKLLGAGTSIILGKTAMTTIGNLLSSMQAALATKAGTAAIIATTTVATVGGGYVTYNEFVKPEFDQTEELSQRAEERNERSYTFIKDRYEFIEYKNEKLGIQFKYPNEYKVTTDEPNKKVIVDDGHYAELEIAIIPKDTACKAEELTDYNHEKFTMDNGVSAIMFTSKDEFYSKFVAANLTTKEAYCNLPLEVSNGYVTAKILVAPTNFDPYGFMDIVKTISASTPTTALTQNPYRTEVIKFAGSDLILKQNVSISVPSNAKIEKVGISEFGSENYKITDKDNPNLYEMWITSPYESFPSNYAENVNLNGYTFFRSKIKKTDTMWVYVSSMNTNDGCMSPDGALKAPCGNPIMTWGVQAETHYSLRVQCKAEGKEGLDICDSIARSIQDLNNH